MTILNTASALAFLLLTNYTAALSVTLGSPCASACLNPGQDASDTNTSKTLGSDITCLDSHYSTTAAGEKFASCLNCLQISTFSNSDESDQNWFLYNLRYGFSTCLFQFANATDIISTPCSTSKSCGPLQQALENDGLDPSHENQYGYCTANSNSFRGASYGQCEGCLRESDDEKYLANFLVALDAGCNQQPPAGWLIGMKGVIFSTIPVNITFPGDNATTPLAPNKKIDEGVIIGIVAAIVIILIIVSFVTLLCVRKYRERRRERELLVSPLDPRYGAQNITSPNPGAYGNPYSSSSIKDAKLNHFNPNEWTASAKPIPFPPDNKSPDGWQDNQSPLSSIPPSYTSSGIPTHQAYIPTRSPVSPLSTTRENYNLPTYYNTSRNRPPPISTTSQENSFSPRQVLPSEVQENIQHASRIISPVSPPTRPTSRAARTRSTGVGNVNAGKDGGSHASRFDFELAETEMRTREGTQGRVLVGKGTKADRTPDSANSDEMWPGTY